MEGSFMVPLLTFATLCAVVVFALVSKNRIAERQHSNTRKSTLAADAPNTTRPGKTPVDT